MREPPPPPSLCRTVPAPALKEGVDARAALARHRAAFLAANGALAECRAWYEGVAARLSGETR